MAKATVTLQEIPGGVLGTAATTRQMQRLVARSKRDPQIIRLVAHIVNNALCRARAHLCEVRAIFGYVRSKVHYMWDPNGIEMLQSPQQAIARGAGDCDCLSVLFSTLCESAGLKTAFVTIKADPRYRDKYTHVYSSVSIPELGKWVPADLSAPHPLGWEHPAANDKRNVAVWPGSGR